MPKRVAVLIDYQNVRERARACFGLAAASHPEGRSTRCGSLNGSRARGPIVR